MPVMVIFAGLEHVAACGDGKRLSARLLDQKHRGASSCRSLTIWKICSIRIGARPIEGSSSISSLGYS